MQYILRTRVQFLIFSLISILAACAPYPYEKHIKSHRIDTFGIPSRSTKLVVEGRSKAGYRPYNNHTLGVAFHNITYSELVEAPGLRENHSGTIMAAGIAYTPRFNVLEMGDLASFSLEFPMSIIVPIMSEYDIHDLVWNVPLYREAPAFPEIGFYLPATINFNFGRGAQELVRGMGIGVGAGYWIGITPVTDFRDNNATRGYGPFSHGPYGGLTIRFGSIELSGFTQYSIRHSSMHLGGKLGISF